MTYSFDRQKGVANDYRNLYAQIAEQHFGSEFLCWQSVPDGSTPAQKAGIDAFVALKSGKVHTVDTKLDAFDTPRIAIEILSNVEHDKPGWATNTDMLNDWFMYVRPKQALALMLPRVPLQTFVAQNLSAWNEQAAIPDSGYIARYVPNIGYRTFCLMVPMSMIVERFPACLVSYG